jgi:multicomponent Na+:H+ antiporter subunit G
MIGIHFLGEILIFTGLIFVATGVFCVIRLRNFYNRILVTSIIDTLGFVTIVTGILLTIGLSWISFKLIVIAIFTIITTPLATHAVLNSLYQDHSFLNKVAVRAPKLPSDVEEAINKKEEKND